MRIRLSKWLDSLARGATVYSKTGSGQENEIGLSSSPTGESSISDLGAAIDRAWERHRRIGLSVAVSIVARVTTAVSTLISIPLTLNYLAPERFGLWMTISSFVTFFSFAELGLGYGLLNAISESHGTENREMAREYTSSAFFLLSCIAAILFGIGLLCYGSVSWGGIFKVSSQVAMEEAGPASTACFVCFVIGIPLSVAQRVHNGYQEGYINSFWEACGAVLGLLGLWIAVKLGAGLPWLVICLTGGPAFSLLLNSIRLFVHQRPWLVPRLKFATLSAVKVLFKTGLMFLVMQISYAITFTADNFIIAQFLGPEAVAEFAVPVRLFNVIQVFIGVLLAPLWPAYGEAVARGDLHWIRTTLRRSIYVSMALSAAFSFTMTIFGVRIISMWVGPSHPVSVHLVLALGVWTVVWAGATSVGTFLNGIGAVRLQMYCFLGMAGIAVAGKLLFLSALGLPAIVWSTVVATVVCVLVPYAAKVPRILDQLARKHLDGEAGNLRIS